MTRNRETREENRKVKAIVRFQVALFGPFDMITSWVYTGVCESESESEREDEMYLI